MSDGADDGDANVEVQGLLVCRGVQGTSTGGIDVKDVVDVLVVPSFPAEVGPLTFAAFVRSKRPGEAEVSFRVHPAADPSKTLVTLPGRLTVQKGYEGRQSVIGSGFKTLKVHAGGWYGVEFRLGDAVLARTRFAIGSKAPAKPSA
jgi:hypothetical protein